MVRPLVALVALACHPDVGPVDSLPSPDTDTDTDDTDTTVPVDTPLTIDGSAEGVGTRMCLATDGTDSTIYVLFHDPNDVWLNRSLDLGRTWLAEPVQVDRGARGQVFDPELYCNALGVFVVWEDDRDGDLGNHQVYFNRSTDRGANFAEADVLLERDPQGDSMSLGPVIRGNGADLFVAWYDSVHGAYDILVARSDDAGATWSNPVRADSDPVGSGYSARPTLALGDELVHVAWEDSRDGAADLYAARTGPSGAFEADQRIDLGDAAGETDAFEPKLCADGDDVYVAWHDARNGERDILVNHSADAGETWLPAAIRLDEDPAGAGNSLFPSCVIDDDTLHVAWRDQRKPDAGYHVYYRRLVAGEPDGAEVRLDTPTVEGGDASSVAMAFDGSTVVVAWLGPHDLHYNQSRDGVPFAAADLGIPVDPEPSDLQVAVLGDHWFAAWTDGLDTPRVRFVAGTLGDAP